MTVGEIIKELEKYDKNCEVETTNSTFSDNGLDCKIVGVSDMMSIFPEVEKRYCCNTVLLLLRE